MTKQELIAAIAAAIYTNVTQDIDGDELRNLMIETANITVGQDSQADVVSPNIAGNGQITVTNGSAAVVGIGTDWVTNTETISVGTQQWFSFTDSNGDTYYCELGTINSDTSLDIGFSRLINDFAMPESPTFQGVSGTYDYFIFANAVIGTGTNGGNIALGNNTFRYNNSGLSIGLSVFSSQQGSVGIGAFIKLLNGGSNSAAVGFGIESRSPDTSILGNGNTIGTLCSGSGLIASPNSVINDNIPNCIGVGLNGVTISDTALSGSVVVPAIAYYNPVPEYADNADALLAGLVIGQVYRTGDFQKVVH